MNSQLFTQSTINKTTMKTKVLMLARGALLAAALILSSANANASQMRVQHSFSFYAETIWEMLYPRGLIPIKNTTGYPRTPAVFWVQPDPKRG